jgi:hypothetical protein
VRRGERQAAAYRRGYCEPAEENRESAYEITTQGANVLSHAAPDRKRLCLNAQSDALRDRSGCDDICRAETRKGAPALQRRAQHTLSAVADGGGLLLSLPFGVLTAAPE